MAEFPIVDLSQQEPGTPVNHPPHYQNVPGIECIDVIEHFSLLRGNAIKYLWRAGSKGDPEEDLLKAVWYIQRELSNIRKLKKENPLIAVLPDERVK